MRSLAFQGEVGKARLRVNLEQAPVFRLGSREVHLELNLTGTLLDLLAFGLTAFMAFKFEWRANELCWGLWISSLLTGWLIILSSVLRSLLHLAGIVRLREEDLAGADDPLSAYFRKKAFSTRDLPDGRRFISWTPMLVAVGILVIGGFTWFHFTFFHTVHGLLMSVFVSMEPKELFGPDGFINADSNKILAYLVDNYWAMILATFVARRSTIYRGNPGATLKIIYQSVVRIHVFILLSAFLFFLIYFGIETYERVLLIILLFLFFFPFHLLRRKEPV